MRLGSPAVPIELLEGAAPSAPRRGGREGNSHTVARLDSPSHTSPGADGAAPSSSLEPPLVLLSRSFSASLIRAHRTDAGPAGPFAWHARCDCSETQPTGGQE